jgi:hypothetical protein
VAHETAQLRTHTPAVLGVYPGMQVAHIPLLHVWHFSGHWTHVELTKERPGAQEVHWVILVELQLEQDIAHPRQVPLL